jgi:small GTP-binding protein
MIRDLFIIKMLDQICVFHQSYSRTPVDESLVIGFVGAMSAMISSMPEKSTKSVPAGTYKFTYSHTKGYIFVLCSDVDDDEKDLNKKLGDAIERVAQKYIPYLTDPNLSKEKRDELNDIIDKLLLSEIKVALVGFGGVGKTTLYQLIQGYDIPLDYLPTMFVAYKRLDGKIAETDVLIWDFAGQERFTPLWPMLLRGTHVVLLVTDSTVENVLQTKRVFMKLIKKARPDAICIGIANKQDLPKAMAAPLVKKVLGVDEVHGVCAIDPSERRKLQNIIAHGIELYLAQQAQNEKLL